MKKYKIAAVLMILHASIELGGIFALIPILLSVDIPFDIRQSFSFIVPYLQENLHLMLIIGGVYGTIRLIGAVALLRRRVWGLALCVINCVISLALMIFMLPAGIMDGILAGAALILMLMQYFGGKSVTSDGP